VTHLIRQCILSRGLIATAAVLITLAVSNHARAAISQGPVLTNTTAAEQRRLNMFYQAEQSYQEKLKVGRERFHKKEVDRAKTIAAMSSELQARRESVVIEPIETPRVDPNLPVGWFKSSMLVGMLVAGVLGFVSFVNRARLQEAFVDELEPLEPEPPVVIIPIQEQVFMCEGDGANGRGMYREDGFMILKGSFGRLNDQGKLVESGVVRLEGETIIFEEDHLFRSPSMAAAALLGRTANGWVEWKNKDGATLDTVARQQPTGATDE
jgi:hypothetical protein